MTNSRKPLKTTAVLTAMLIAGTALVPVTPASAHDRHRAHSHGHVQNHHRNVHRKAHRHNRKRRNNDGELIAAGIIGLAIGAIIAGEASKNREPVYTPQYSAPYPSHGGNYYGYDGYGTGQRVPLNDYNAGNYGGGNYHAPASNGGPNVITFNDPGSLEPWTPGWRAWCEDNYRSFNPSTGTFRGYDGLDHFCVPR